MRRGRGTAPSALNPAGGIVEARTLTQRAPAAAFRPFIAALRRHLGGWGLIAALAALPVFYAIKDLSSGYQTGIVHGHAVVAHNLTLLGPTSYRGSPTAPSGR